MYESPENYLETILVISKEKQEEKANAIYERHQILTQFLVLTLEVK